MPGGTREIMNPSDMPRASTIAANDVIAGVRASGAPTGFLGSVITGPINELTQRVENAESGVAANYETLAELEADLGYDAGAIAHVYGDPDVALRGVYKKSGASGAGSWTRIGPIPTVNTDVLPSQMSTRDWTNAYPDSNMEDTSLYTGDVVRLGWAGSSPSQYAIAIAAKTGADEMLSAAWAAEPGVSYFVSGGIGKVASDAGDVTLQFFVDWFSDVDSTVYISSDQIGGDVEVNDVTTGVVASRTVQAPAGARRAKFRLAKGASATAIRARWVELFVSRALPARAFDPQNIPLAAGDNLEGLSQSRDLLNREPLTLGNGIYLSTSSSSGRNLRIDPGNELLTRNATPVWRDGVMEIYANIGAGSGGLPVDVEIGLVAYNGGRGFLYEEVLYSFTGLTGDSHVIQERFTRFSRYVGGNADIFLLPGGPAYVLPFIRVGGDNPLYVRFLEIRMASGEDILPSQTSNASKGLVSFEDRDGRVMSEISETGDYVFGEKKLSGLFSLVDAAKTSRPMTPRFSQMRADFADILNNLRAWKGSNAVAPVPRGQVAENWTLSDPAAFLATTIPYAYVAPLTIDTQYSENGQVVHPFLIQFYGHLLGEDTLMAITPYPGTVDFYENPFLYGVRNDTEFSLLIGPPQPLGVPRPSTAANYNSDPFVYYDFHRGDLVFVWRNGGTALGFDLIARRTVDGIHWGEPYIFHSIADTAGILQLSECVQYLPEYDLYVMYAIAEGSGFTGRKFAYKLMNPNGEFTSPWQYVETPFPDIWHLEVKRVGTGFVAIFNDNYTSRQLYLGYSSDGFSWDFAENALLTGAIEPSYKATIATRLVPGASPTTATLDISLYWTTSDRSPQPTEDQWRMRFAQFSAPVTKT